MPTESDVHELEDLASDMLSSVNETIGKIKDAKNVDEINDATNALTAKTSSWKNRIPRE